MPYDCFCIFDVKGIYYLPMQGQNKLFIDALARLVLGVENKKGRHQIDKSDRTQNVNPDRKEDDPHCHESWELKIPLRGRLHCRFDDRNIDVQQNSVLLIAPKSIHYSTTPADIRHCAVWLNCLFENGDVQLALMKGQSTAYYVLSSDQKSELTTLLGQPANEFCGHIASVINHACKQAGQQMATKWLALLFSSFISAILLPPVSSPWHELVSRTIALMNNASRDATMTVRRMAEILNVSPKYLSVVFHRMTGVTPRQKLIRIRLERAFRQLQTGNYSVKEVAAFTGWQNQFYFSNSFRRHYGMAPSKVPIRMKTILPSQPAAVEMELDSVKGRQAVPL